ncbi:Nucleic acid-binding, OB-fold [Sesbania bispinosa]|nr:Nucleic acid-binding, OB-fold [Sesbania bispinosa]
MSRRIISLYEIVSGGVDWKIRVKVIRLWNGTDFEDPSIKKSIEMVFLDEKGTRMPCIIKKALMATFENEFKEGSCYLIQNIMIAHNEGRFKTTSHKFKLSFMANTRVQQINCESFPINAYQFVPFDQINDGRPTNLLIDVIGHIVQKDEIKVNSKNNNTTKRIELVLEELE